MYGDVTHFGAGAQYCAELERLGVDALHRSDWIGLEQVLKNSLRGGLFRILRSLSSLELRRHEEIVLEDCRRFQPDLVINLKGLHWRRDFVERLRKLPVPVILINHDDFFSRYRSVRSAVQRGAVPAYDRILTTRRVNVDELQARNPRVEFFPFAYSPQTHRRIEPTSEQRDRLTCDIVFVGTHAAHRAQLLERLSQRVPYKLMIHGGGWNKLGKTSPLRRHIASGGLFGDDMCAAFGLAKVSLGFLRKENRDEYTQRSFEIPACGGVMLAERTPTHNELYREGVEAEFFDPNSVEELCQKTTRLCNDPTYRESIRSAGESAVLSSKNTYADRAKRILEILEELSPKFHSRMQSVHPQSRREDPLAP
jgi:spore maturation protein CgeB